MSVADVRDFERALVDKGTPLAELMRRAGAVVAMQAARLVHHGSVVVLCGMGNNGGDGWVAADNLARHGYEVSVVTPATPAVMRSELARRMATRTSEMGVPVHVAPTREELEELLLPADVVIDACFGIGFHGELPEPYATWADVLDGIFDGQVVAVDVPSGIDATSGMAQGPFFAADVTVTMFAAKPGLVSGVGRQASGRVVVASLVEGDEGLQDISDAAAAFVLEERDYLDVLPEPDPLQDKYTRGRVLVVGGSTRYPGAAIMAAQAAARAGAGYVTLAVPAPVVPIAQMHLLSIPVVSLPADPEGSFSVEASDRVGALAERADVVLAGPGMTTSLGACEVVRALLRSDRALVLDADALNAVVRICAGSAEAHPAALRREAPLVLTPHRRELARLMGGELERTETLAGAMEAAQALAWAVGSANFCVVAKGPVSAVATIDSTLIPQPGPVALATAGTGDVLAGITASLLAQGVANVGEDEEGLDSSDLLMLIAGADRVHAVAGELACRTHGSRGVVAPDVAQVAGRAIDELLRRSERDFDEAGEDPGSVLEGAAALSDEDGVRALQAALIEDDPADLEEPTSEPERTLRAKAGATSGAAGARADGAAASAEPAGASEAEEAGEGAGASANAGAGRAEGAAGDEKAPAVAEEGPVPAEDEESPAPQGGVPAGETTVMAPICGEAEPAPAAMPAAPAVAPVAAPATMPAASGADGGTKVPAASGAAATESPASEAPAAPSTSASEAPAVLGTSAASEGETPATTCEADVASDPAQGSEAGVPPFLARMSAFVAGGSTLSGEAGPDGSDAPADAPTAPEAPAPTAPEAPAASAAGAANETATPAAPGLATEGDDLATKAALAATPSRLPAFLTAALGSRPVGQSLDAGAEGAPATFDASIEIAPPPAAPQRKSPVEAFHESATLHMADASVVPPDERPSVTKRAKSKRTKR